MKRSNKVIFLVLDACRHDYITPTSAPFLASKRTSSIYVKKLKSTSGFTQRTAIYTGTTGAESGKLCMFTFDRENSPFHFLENDPRSLQYATPRPSDPAFEQARFEFLEWARAEAGKYANFAPLTHIPLPIAHEFGVSEDSRPIHLPGAYDQESIFDVFCDKGIQYEYLMYPVVNCDDAATHAALLEGRSSSADLIMGLYSSTDEKIHHCGPSSLEARKIVREIDSRVEELVRAYPPDTTWLIIGDHGMADVREEFDVPASLRMLEAELGVEMGTDYVLFLDSTMARFRWKTEIGKQFLERVPELSQFHAKGLFVDADVAHSCEIPFGDRRDGDLIWWANNGVLLFPDYFHDALTHNVGMHGYRSDHDDMKGFLLLFGPDQSPQFFEERRLIDVCPTVCDLLAVPRPRQNRGISLAVLENSMAEA